MNDSTVVYVALNNEHIYCGKTANAYTSLIDCVINEFKEGEPEFYEVGISPITVEVFDGVLCARAEVKSVSLIPPEELLKTVDKFDSELGNKMGLRSYLGR